MSIEINIVSTCKSHVHHWRLGLFSFPACTLHSNAKNSLHAQFFQQNRLHRSQTDCSPWNQPENFQLPCSVGNFRLLKSLTANLCKLKTVKLHQLNLKSFPIFSSAYMIVSHCHLSPAACFCSQFIWFFFSCIWKAYPEVHPTSSDKILSAISFWKCHC